MQDYQTGADASLGLIPILLIVGLYAYFAYCQAKMAQKCGHADKAWWAWIPILNTFLLFKMANKPNWWFFLCLVPVINIVAFAILWMEAAKACQTSPVWGFLVLVPFVNLVSMGIMAFSSPPATAPPPHTPQPREPEHVG
jgi:hypothetical protein